MPILDKPLKEDRDKNTLLHAMLFPKSKFTLEQSKEWLRVHNYKYIHNRQTKNIWRFRIREQIRGFKFFTKTLKNGIEMVFMFK